MQLTKRTLKAVTEDGLPDINLVKALQVDLLPAIQRLQPAFEVCDDAEDKWIHDDMAALMRLYRRCEKVLGDRTPNTAYLNTHLTDPDWQGSHYYARWNVQEQRWYYRYSRIGSPVHGAATFAECRKRTAPIA